MRAPHLARLLSLSVALITRLVAQIPGGPGDGTAPGSAEATIAGGLAAARPTAREQQWRLVPFRRTLTQALAEAARDRRPVYVFLADGEFATGDC